MSTLLSTAASTAASTATSAAGDAADAASGTADPAPVDADATFTQREFRDAVGGFASGITVITTLGPEGPVGFTCQSFISVSLDPPLISFSIARTSQSLAALRDHGSIVVNFLSAGQQHLSAQFARSGTDKWAGVDWYPSESNGAPTLSGGTGWLAGRVEREIAAGDHLIFLVAVTDISADATRAPLLFYRGGYHEIEYQI